MPGAVRTPSHAPRAHAVAAATEPGRPPPGTAAGPRQGPRRVPRQGPRRAADVYPPPGGHELQVGSCHRRLLMTTATASRPVLRPGLTEREDGELLGLLRTAPADRGEQAAA